MRCIDPEAAVLDEGGGVTDTASTSTPAARSPPA